MDPCVYMMASQRNGTLYIGVTSNLLQRVWQHREGLGDGFAKKYGVKILVWYEQHATMESAIRREKALKKWNRNWKLNLIEKENLHWQDLWPEITGQVAGVAWPHTRHSREGGDPCHGTDNGTPASFSRRPREGGDPGQAPLDSRLRGNDGADGEVV